MTDADVDATTVQSAVDEVPMLLRPSLRGALHRWSVPVAITLVVLLAIRADGAGPRAAVIVYGICITGMLATSGVYHAARWTSGSKRVLRRLDHSMILVGIAGTYTAVIVLGLDGAERVVMLVVAWVIAAVGVAIRMFWLDAPSGLVALVYLVAGWEILLDLPGYAAGLTGGELALLAVGGGLYTVGAVIYALKRPDPWPAVFGYHEVFHTLVVAAAFSHWLAIWSLAG